MHCVAVEFAGFPGKIGMFRIGLELTETYSPAAMAIAPAASLATPAISASCGDDAAEATPITRLAVEMIPSFAPRTAARSHPIRVIRWLSGWSCRTGLSFIGLGQWLSRQHFGKWPSSVRVRPPNTHSCRRGWA